MKLEVEVGIIAPGQCGNMTVHDSNPLTVDAMRIKDNKVRGTVMVGRKLPARPGAMTGASLGRARRDRGSEEIKFNHAALGHALSVAHGRN